MVIQAGSVCCRLHDGLQTLKHIQVLFCGMWLVNRWPVATNMHDLKIAALLSEKIQNSWMIPQEMWVFHSIFMGILWGFPARPVLPGTGSPREQAPSLWRTAAMPVISRSGSKLRGVTVVDVHESGRIWWFGQVKCPVLLDLDNLMMPPHVVTEFHAFCRSISPYSLLIFPKRAKSKIVSPKHVSCILLYR